MYTFSFQLECVVPWLEALSGSELCRDKCLHILFTYFLNLNLEYVRRFIDLYSPAHGGRFPHFCQVSPWKHFTPSCFGNFPKNLVLPENPQSLSQGVQEPNWQSTVELKKLLRSK